MSDSRVLTKLKNMPPWKLVLGVLGAALALTMPFWGFTKDIEGPLPIATVVLCAITSSSMVRPASTQVETRLGFVDGIGGLYCPWRDGSVTRPIGKQPRSRSIESGGPEGYIGQGHHRPHFLASQLPRQPTPQPVGSDLVQITR